MDGAMKFVKGDVIASLVITVINILGGLAIGVLQRGMPVAGALKRYGLLTIGDGLVSQIPALVLSTAAAVLVTRTASEEPDTPLGQELARQIFGTPKALRAASLFVLALASARQRVIEDEARRARTEPTAALPGPRAGPSFIPMVVPWTVEVSADLEAAMDDVSGAQPSPGLRSAMLELRERLFAELGVPLPPPRVRIGSRLPERTLEVSLFEVPARTLSWPEGADAAAVPRVADQILDLLRARAFEFLGLAEVQRSLDELELLAPATVRNVVPKPVSLTLLVDVLRRLVEERVSVRDLRAILEALATAAVLEKDPLNLAEYLRAQLRRSITFRLTHGEGHLGIHLLDPAIEDAVRRSVTRTPNGAFLTLAPAASRDVIAAVKRAVSESSAEARGQAPVLLTQPDIRRFVRKLVESEIPELTVVSFAELLPEVSLRPLGKAVLAPG
jgi:type III secretion protein V